MTAILMIDIKGETCRTDRCSDWPRNANCNPASADAPSVSQIVVFGSFGRPIDRLRSNFTCRRFSLERAGQSDLSCAAIANHFDHRCAKWLYRLTVAITDSLTQEERTPSKP